MSDTRDSDDEAGAPAREPAEAPPPTAYEHMLVRDAAHVIAPSAKRIARKFPRLIHDRGLMTLGDLQALGLEALYHAARAFNDSENPDFVAFARYYVRGAMLDALDDLLFEERVKRAAAKTADNFCAFHRDDDYNVMKHDGAEAQRRYRAFANGVVAATLAAALEEAAQCIDMAELLMRREYERALSALRAALTRVSEADRRLLAAQYRDRKDLKAASAALGVPYGTARARHARALKLLYEALVEQGITRAPRPLVVPDIEGVIGPQQNDTDTSGLR